MPAQLLLASGNAHKLRELAALLRPHELTPLPPGVELPPESGATFGENAALKACAAARATGRPALADDSGIEAVALGGRPGVRSARFAGEGASDEDNLAKLLREVPPGADTRAAYVCVLAYAEPVGTAGPGGAGDSGGAAGPRGAAGALEPAVRLFAGRCEGKLTHQPRGDAGFGYDPAFIPDGGDGRTMAELSPAEKHAISHRGRAARALLDWLDGAGAAAA